MINSISKWVLIKLLIVITVSGLFFSGCVPSLRDTDSTPKYVFLFIGDGMGQSQITAAEIYAHSIKSREIGQERLSFSGFPYLGMMTTYSSNSYFTDSAAAGTAMASGYKTRNAKININEDETLFYKTLTEAVQSSGRKTGIISSVSLDHATPACFYCRVPYRWQYYDIAAAMAESGIDFLGGGGLKYPTGVRGQHPDVRNIAQEKGYALITTLEAFHDLSPGSGKVWAFNPNLTRKSALPYEIDRPEKSLTLEDFTRKAISFLDNPSGFFIVAEGGKIDWACHDNDAASAVHETLAFSNAVRAAVEFYHEHPNETLIVVTADHETGGMMLGSKKAVSGMKMNLLSHQNMSLDQFEYQILKPYLALTPEEDIKLEDLYPDIQEKFGLIRLSGAQREKLRLEAESGDTGAQEKLDLALTPMEWRELETALADPAASALGFAAVKILNEKAGISWGSYSHTALPVPVFAIGAGAERFQGSYDNTDIAKKLFDVMNLSFPKPFAYEKNPRRAAAN